MPLEYKRVVFDGELAEVDLELAFWAGGTACSVEIVLVKLVEIEIELIQTFEANT